VNRQMSSRKVALVIAALIAMAVSSRAQQRVLKLVEVTKEPPCSTWGDITSCAPNGGAITWGGGYNTTYTWTMPPNEIGPAGVSIILNVSQSNPSERRAATGLRLTGSGFIFDQASADLPVGAPGQPLSGSRTVTIKPPQNPSGDYYLKIGVYWGPGFVYHYRAEVSSSRQPQTPLTQPSPQKARAAVAWAQTQIGSETWRGRCQGFVEEAYGVRGAFRSALAASKALDLQKTPVQDAPSGALLYFAPSENCVGAVSPNYGHTGLSIGGGKMIEARGRVVVTDVSKSRLNGAYVGWAYPPGTWPGRKQ